MCRTSVKQHFHLVTLLDLNLTLTFTYYRAHTYTLPSSIPEKPFGKVWVRSPVLVADKEKSDRFDIRPDLDPASDR